QRIITSASGLFIEGTVLCGFLLGSDHKLHFAQIDLNNYYGNQNGQFVTGDRYFGNTAQNIDLATQNERGKVMLRAQLRNYNYGYNQAEVNLAICVVNQGGQFAFVRNDGFFGADGWLAQTMESMAYAGFVMAILRKTSGDEDRFRRAMIHASGSTAVSVLGAIGGKFGGPIGAALIAGAATPLKMLLEQWAGSNLINDPVLRQEFEEATLGKYIIETITSM
ncbi:Cyanovirin-N, partial [Mycena crocata]